jgi:hypothetical protein
MCMTKRIRMLNSRMPGAQTLSGNLTGQWLAEALASTMAVSEDIDS